MAGDILAKEKREFFSAEWHQQKHLNIPLSELSSPLFFHNFTDLYRFIALNSYLDEEQETLTKLAAESRTEDIFWLSDRNGKEYIIYPNYYGDYGNQLRGAQNNGFIYVVNQNKNDLALVGILKGNMYHVDKPHGDTIRTYWHGSAFEGEINMYKKINEVYNLFSFKTVTAENCSAVWEC